MKKQKQVRRHSRSISQRVREQIEAGGERIWRFADFNNMAFTAVAQALSRLTQQGIIQRLGKGLYYCPRQTAFGQSKPSLTHINSLTNQKNEIFPAGYGAANLLGFSTQNPAKLELATNRLSLPRLLVGYDTIIHTRRPEAWKRLSNQDAAILDFLRQGGRTSELSPAETVSKLLEYFHEKGQYESLVRIADSEPPRVRALLGAIGQEIGCKKNLLLALKRSLNPLSRFDFGNLISLKYAKQWQAKESKYRETI